MFRRDFGGDFMKKRLAIVPIVASMVLAFGCGKTEEAVAPEEEQQAVEDAIESAASQEQTEAVEEVDSTDEEEPVLPEIDISGCDTFTQIVDKKLEPGMGYANEKIGDEDVLLVCDMTYDDQEGHTASIDSIIFCYIDGVPTEIGSVVAAGTAYPIAVEDGVLYVGRGHSISKYTIENSELVHVATAGVDYGVDGSETYYYQEGDGEEETLENDEKYNQLADEYFDASIVDFTVVVE